MLRSARARVSGGLEMRWALNPQAQTEAHKRFGLHSWHWQSGTGPPYPLSMVRGPPATDKPRVNGQASPSRPVPKKTRAQPEPTVSRGNHHPRPPVFPTPLPDSRHHYDINPPTPWLTSQPVDHYHYSSQLALD
jgi:hypothetical protein